MVGFCDAGHDCIDLSLALDINQSHLVPQKWIYHFTLLNNVCCVGLFGYSLFLKISVIIL